MWRCLAAAVVLVLFLSISQPASAVTYRIPIDGVVVDPYRPPVNPYGSGNRGWEFRVDSNTHVFAPADGTVTFSGQVGGVLNLVIQHADGMRTTLRKLQSIDVSKGDAVVAGQRIGIASNEFYFGARCGAAYVDPQLLFNRRVHLVPLEGGESTGAANYACNAQTISAEQQQWLSARVGPGSIEASPDESGIASAVADVMQSLR